MNIAKLCKKFGGNDFYPYTEISKPNLQNNQKQLFAMKNLILILGLIATTALSAQDAVQYNIDIAPFNYLDYTFADVFFVDRDGNVNQRAHRKQLLPGSKMCGRNSTALNLGSLVIVDMYDRYGDFTHSFSAYVVEDELGNVSAQVVEPSPIVSLTVGGQDNYTDFILEEY